MKKFACALTTNPAWLFVPWEVLEAEDETILLTEYGQFLTIE